MRPLEGVRVLDLTRLLPGPAGSLVLGDLGAHVDKIEEPGGDYLRAIPGAFVALNRNKRSATIDLKKPEARAAFLRLVRSYDVLLEQFRPGVLDRLGLAHATLCEANPRLIVGALTGYGQTGPLAQRAGHDLNYLARGGVLGFQGPPEGPPAMPGVQVADVSGGLYLVIGVMGALLERARTGLGQILDVAMIETAMPFALAGFGGIGVITGAIAPYNTYLTKDGRAMALGALEPKFWMQFCVGIGRTAALDDLVPGAHQAALKAALAQTFAARTQAEWIAFAAERDCCLEPVLDAAEARRDPHLAARRMFFELAGTTQLRTPLTDPDRAHTVPPAVGEHTAEILRDAGFDDDEIAELRAQGAVGTGMPPTPSGSA